MSLQTESRLFRLFVIAAAIAALAAWITRHPAPPEIEVVDAKPAAAISFEANLGQADQEYAFLVRAPGHASAIAADRVLTRLDDSARAEGPDIEMHLLGSDPHAEAFYLAAGAVRIGSRPSDSIAGRELPLLEFRFT